MDKLRTLLWIDICTDNHAEDSLLHHCQKSWNIHKITRTDDISKNIYLRSPGLLCFDFDYPDSSGLTLISHIRSTHPELPVIIITRYHSEALALWALRLRIWDIQLKPVDTSLFMCMIEKIISDSKSNKISYCPCMKLPHLPLDNNNHDHHRPTHKKTNTAVTYVTEHYSSKISINDMADLCHMSSRRFSHEFKCEHGLPFKEFLLRYRIDMAQIILDENHDSSITGVAMSVGFNDHSYFTRVFRRYVGVNPSLYSQHTNRELRSKEAPKLTS